MELKETIMLFGQGYIFDIEYDLMFDDKKWNAFDNQLWRKGIMRQKRYYLFNKKGGDKMVDKYYDHLPDNEEVLKTRWLKMYKELEINSKKTTYPELI